jgi:hypothetical protein
MENDMSKIHELLAAEGDRTSVARELVGEAATTFSKRTDHFSGHTKKVEYFEDTRSGENTSDHSELVTTVGAKLAHVWEFLTPALDIQASKENSNTSQEARADVIVDGKTVLTGVPATALLGLEKRVRELKNLYFTIPTLDPGIAWELAAELGDGVWRTRHAQEQIKTEKVLKSKVLYDATKEHPAQVKEYTIDQGVAKMTTTRLSGMVSPAEKALWISRISKLETAIKEARQRANMAEVVELNVGDAIEAFIHE